jgi:hypothetical protein
LSIFEFLPELLCEGMKEVMLSAPTTPKGKRYDRVMYKGLLKHNGSFVDTDVLTDHYPICSEFEIEL